MSRSRTWLQLVAGWLPLWALFVTLILTAHQYPTVHGAMSVATRMVVAGLLLGPLVARFVRRLPWPNPMHLAFVTQHLMAAAVYAVLFVGVNSVIVSILRVRAVLVVGNGLGPFLILGVWLYIMNAGVLYATEGSTRAARSEAAAAQAQLAALRGQLNPHFLFNALHTVVQLAPKSPDKAARAAEDLAGLLRSTIEENRDIVTLGEEWQFVSRYLDLERLRFGDRLIVAADLTEESRDLLIPAFALQTLVENAVRHGAAPRVEATTITIRARAEPGLLEVSVTDDGVGVNHLAAGAAQPSAGTGLERLRQRLAALYGVGGTLAIQAAAPSGYSALLRIPQRHER